MSYSILTYEIGDNTAKKLVEVLEWSKPIWRETKNSIYLREFLKALKCQV